MARLFYPILISLTAMLLAVQWRRHDLPTRWLHVFGAREAQAQAPYSDSAPPPSQRRPPPQADTGTPGRQPRAAQLPRTSFVRSVGGRPAPTGRPQGFVGGTGPAQVDPRNTIAFDNAKKLAQVGGELILMCDVIGSVNMHIKQQFGPDIDKVPKRQYEAMRDSLVRGCVQQLVETKMLLLEARDKIPEDKYPEVQKNIGKKFDEVQLAQYLTAFGVKTVKELEVKLKEVGTTIGREKQRWIEHIIAGNWLHDHVKADEIEISHRELLEYYHAHLDDYRYPARVRWEELRVTFSNHPTKEAARAKMQQMANQVARGRRWADVARAQSEDADAAHGGAHNWTAQGTYKVKELEDALWTLPIKQMSPPIEDDKGLSVVRVVERKPAGVESFLDVQEAITKKLKEARLQKMQDEYMQSVKDRYQSQIWTIYDDQPAEKAAKNRSPTRR